MGGSHDDYDARRRIKWQDVGVYHHFDRSHAFQRSKSTRENSKFVCVVRTVRDTKIMVEKTLTLVANKLEDKPQGLLVKVIKDRVMT